MSENWKLASLCDVHQILASNVDKKTRLTDLLVRHVKSGLREQLNLSQEFTRETAPKNEC